MVDFASIATVIFPAISIVVSAIVSWRVARIAADKEIEKLKMQWAYEKSSKYEADFLSMVEHVTYCITCRPDSDIRLLRQKVAQTRSVFSGELGKSIDELYNTISSSPTASEVETALNRVIETKRNAET